MDFQKKSNSLVIVTMKWWRWLAYPHKLVNGRPLEISLKNIKKLLRARWTARAQPKRGLSNLDRSPASVWPDHVGADVSRASSTREVRFFLEKKTRWRERWVLDWRGEGRAAAGASQQSPNGAGSLKNSCARRLGRMRSQAPWVEQVVSAGDKSENCGTLFYA
jgi:hypothetical protein